LHQSSSRCSALV
ncbi:hypothetical protein VCHC44C1_3405B, partial [Vibrio cholerae HC-44C1]